MSGVTPDLAYWMLSTIAQSCSALMAILITGYIFHQKSLVTDDHTLKDIYQRIRKVSFRWMMVLQFLYLVTIVLSIITMMLISNIDMILVCDACSTDKEDIYIDDTLATMYFASVALFIVSLVFTVEFVYKILHPDIISDTAAAMMDEMEAGHTSGKDVEISTFLNMVTQLEDGMSDAISNRKGPYDPDKDPMPFSRKIEMIGGIKGLSAKDVERLKRVRKYRNSAIHSKDVRYVNKDVVEDVKKLTKLLKRKGDK